MASTRISLTFKGIKDRELSLDQVVLEALCAWLEAHPEDGTASRVSRTKVRRLIMAGQVELDGRPVRHPGLVMRKGNHLCIALDSGLFFQEIQNDDLAFVMDQSRILFEDEWLMVVDKPACLPVEATVVEGRLGLHQAVRDFLATRDGVPEPCLGLHHRLDRETSGLILFSRHKDANSALHQAFLQRKVQKTYLALVLRPLAAGPGKGSRNPSLYRQAKHPGAQPGTGAVLYREISDLLEGRVARVENRLGRISPKSTRGKWGPVEEGDPALTEFSVHQELKHGLVLAACPHTGRTHQIRVHAAGLGLPLLGDTLYGGSPDFQAGRVMLHAWRLALTHPVLGTPISLEASPPDDFMQCRAALDR